MLEETTGLSERRATTVVTVILFVEALWVFLHKYLPLDAGLWALQSELVQLHMSGHTGDGWKLIPFPQANVLGPFVTGLLSFVFSGEVVTRLALSFGAIFLRGLGILMLFRVLRVRDETIYYLIPVLAMTGLWFTGAMPYLLGETATIWILAFFLSQDRPQGIAYWFISLGLLVAALFHALVFLFGAFVVMMVMMEQRRTVHLSQGWLSSPRAVMSLLVPGAIILALTIFTGEPVFRLSTSNLIPRPSLGRLIFFITPAPDVLEATFRYGDVLHGLVTILFIVVLLGCFGRAYLLAIEEVTWQSRAIRTAGYLLLVLAALGPVFAKIGVETSSWLIFAVILILGGAYSGGPAVRRTPMDRLLYTGSLVTLLITLLLNGFSVNVGSSAAEDVIKTSRRLVVQERQTALEDEHVENVRFRFVLDSGLAQNYSAHSVGTLSYSESAPIYLFTQADLLKMPWAFEPDGGVVRMSARTRANTPLTTSPAIPVVLASADLYADSTVRILAALPKNAIVSPTFGPFDLSLIEDGGANVDKGEASYRLSVGKLRVGRPMQMAARF